MVAAPPDGSRIPMITTTRQARSGATLLQSTSTASASVVAARMAAFANPWQANTPWPRAEAQRMSSEKVRAATRGALAAAAEMAWLPVRMAQIASRPGSWTPQGCMDAWHAMSGLWIGVGNAALRPAQSTVVRNQARLTRRRA